MPMMYPEVRNRKEEHEERQELKTLLASGILSKAPNLQHFLDFIAERYFTGEAEQVKEYSIAVNALNRPETFDPQSDTIVRVTAHSLRKRLEQYYATQGVDHPVQIQLPAGKYVLRFVRKDKEAIPTPQVLKSTSGPAEPLSENSTIRTDLTPLAHVAPQVAAPPIAPRFRQWVIWLIGGVTLSTLLAYILVYQVKRPRALGSTSVTGVLPGLPSGQHAAGQDQTLRLLFGDHVGSYFDAAGQTWSANEYCQGGIPFAHADKDVRGSDDPTIFREGREGKFHCRIPAPPGMYQLQVLFADTAGDKEAARQVVFTINNGPPQAVDVVDEAGANDTAMGKVYAGLRPMQDGFIHLDFISDGSFANAAELIPSQSKLGEPIRMLAGPATFRDSEGKSWGPERFFVGGRRTFHPDNLPKTANAKLFEWERYGHFHYALPVVPGREYSVRLYFSEGWFGMSNGGPGGPESRIFDVYCNGTTLLKNFDILRDQQNGVVVMESHHVKPTANGTLELYFTPVKNYPLINAIEVDPEP